MSTKEDPMNQEVKKKSSEDAERKEEKTREEKIETELHDEPDEHTAWISMTEKKRVNHDSMTWRL